MDELVRLSQEVKAITEIKVDFISLVRFMFFV